MMAQDQKCVLIREGLDAVAKIAGIFAGTVQWEGREVHGYILCRFDDSWELITDASEDNLNQPGRRSQRLSYDQVRRLEDTLTTSFQNVEGS